MPDVVKYLDWVEGRGLSEQLWKGFPRAHIAQDPGRGVFQFDDFLTAGGLVGSNVGGWGGYKTWEDSSCSISLLQGTNAATRGGILRHLTTTTDNIETWCQAGYDGAGPFFVSDTPADTRLLCFEARFRVSTITNDNYGFFIGLMEGNQAVQNTIADAGTLAAKACIGFFRPEGDGDGLDFVYNTNGGTLQTLISDIQTLVADTWYRVGFRFDPNRKDANKGAVFVDNVENSTYVTAALIAAATFPDAEGMNVIHGGKNATNVAYSLDLDWTACGQLSEQETGR